LAAVSSKFKPIEKLAVVLDGEKEAAERDDDLSSLLGPSSPTRPPPSSDAPGEPEASEDVAMDGGDDDFPITTVSVRSLSLSAGLAGEWRTRSTDASKALTRREIVLISSHFTRPLDPGPLKASQGHRRVWFWRGGWTRCEEAVAQVIWSVFRRAASSLGRALWCLRASLAAKKRADSDDDYDFGMDDEDLREFLHPLALEHGWAGGPHTPTVAAAEEFDGGDASDAESDIPSEISDETPKKRKKPIPASKSSSNGKTKSTPSSLSRPAPRPSTNGSGSNSNSFLTQAELRRLNEKEEKRAAEDCYDFIKDIRDVRRLSAHRAPKRERVADRIYPSFSETEGRHSPRWVLVTSIVRVHVDELELPFASRLS
jgi:hypothetical protein